MEQKRQYNLDLFRIFACVMVLILHAAGHNWSKVSPESAAWQAFNFYDVLVRSAVPLFFMLSGKLFLSRDDISLKRLFSKNIFKLVFVYFLWSFLYAVDTIGLKSLMTSFDLSQLWSVFVSGKYHLWYLPSLISVYLLIPVFISIKSYKNGKMLDYIAILFFIFSIAGYSIQLLPLDGSVTELFRKFSFVFDGYCGYFLFGHILDKYSERLKRIPTFVLVFLFFITVSATAAGSCFLSVRAGKGIAVLYDGFFISTFVEAATIFMLFLRFPQLNLSKTAGKVIQKLSKYTLFVYLFHPYVIEHVYLWFGLDTLSFAPVLSVPLISLGLFAVCVAVAMILDKIPFVRKVLL